MHGNLVMTGHEFLENGDGVHLCSPFGIDFSLCGDSLDIGSADAEDCGDLLPTKKKVVTCEKCKSIIEHCRNVKTNSCTVI